MEAAPDRKRPSPRLFGLGPLHKVTLAQARVRAAEYRAQAYQGIDPSDSRKAKRVALAAPTFEKAAQEVHRPRMKGWSNGKHVDQWLNTLRDHAFSVVGAKPVNTIGTPEVLAVLSPIWLTKPETARRVRQRIKVVLEWARAAGFRSGDNPVDLIGDACRRSVVPASIIMPPCHSTKWEPSLTHCKPGRRRL